MAEQFNDGFVCKAWKWQETFNAEKWNNLFIVFNSVKGFKSSGLSRWRLNYV